MLQHDYGTSSGSTTSCYRLHLVLVVQDKAASKECQRKWADGGAVADKDLGRLHHLRNPDGDIATQQGWGRVMQRCDVISDW